jgi:flagellar hook-associated protein 2
MSSLFAVDGLTSGLRTSDIINQLIAIERRPIDRIAQQKDAANKRVKVFQDLNNALRKLQSALDTLILRSAVNAKSFSAANPPGTTVVTGSAGPDAANGTYQVTVLQLATATTVRSTSPIGMAVTANAPLASAGFRTTPTTGTFTLYTSDGTTQSSATITIDASTVLSDGVDNASSNSILGKINNSGLGITATLENDADGRPNLLRLTAPSGVTIRLGSGADTSNFLAAAGLLDAQVNGNTVVSAWGMGGAATNQPLNDNSKARLATAVTVDPAMGEGKFKINGVEITYKGTDTLATVLNRITSSSAGVTATYDPVTDRVQLTSKRTGGTQITLEDATGNFLAAMGLLGASQTLGQQARYTISGVNGGNELTSASNTITGVLPGVTLELKSVSATPVTVTIGQDTDTTVKHVREFVDRFNEVLDLIQQNSSHDQTTKTGGILLGDSLIQQMERTLRRLVADRATGLTGTLQSLADIGISTGAVGSAVGSTNRLILDEAKLRAKLQENPDAVANLFNAYTATATLSGTTGSIDRISGVPTRDHRAGTYTITSDAGGNLSAVFTPDGGAPETAVTGTIAADQSNTTLIPGITLTAKPTLEAGTQTITVTVSERGVLHPLLDFIRNLTAASGVLASRESEENRRIQRLDRTIQQMEERLERKREQLERKFARLEVALAQLQVQGNALGAQILRMSQDTR